MNDLERTLRIAVLTAVLVVLLVLAFNLDELAE